MISLIENKLRGKNMSPANWAEIVLDFLLFCYSLVLKHNDEEFLSSFKSSRSEHFNKNAHFCTLEELINIPYTNSYLLVDWQKAQLPSGINEKTKIFRIKCYHFTAGAGVIKEVVITKKSELLICEAESRFLRRERFDKDKIYEAVKCSVEIASKENLTQLFIAEEASGQPLLEEIYRYTQDVIRNEAQRIAEQKIKEVQQAFQEKVFETFNQ